MATDRLPASSIFLAKEFGVEVWATDLWINATENLERIRKAGMSKQVLPIHADARRLPFADGFFDAVISIDAYHYFGTDDLYMLNFANLVRDGGQIGIVVPGIRTEFGESLPEHLTESWPAEFWTFHSPEWWRQHWRRSGKISVEFVTF